MKGVGHNGGGGIPRKGRRGKGRGRERLTRGRCARVGWRVRKNKGRLV